MDQNYFLTTAAYDLPSLMKITNKPFWIILQKETWNPSFFIYIL